MKHRLVILLDESYPQLFVAYFHVNIPRIPKCGEDIKIYSIIDETPKIRNSSFCMFIKNFNSLELKHMFFLVIPLRSISWNGIYHAKDKAHQNLAVGFGELCLLFF